MTLKQLGELIIWAGGVCAALAAIGVLMRWLVVRPLRTWIVEQTKPAREARDQLQANGGSSARDLLQKTSDQVQQMNGRLDQLADSTRENRDMANAAMTLARDTSERLDRHLVNDHGPTEGA